MRPHFFFKFGADEHGSQFPLCRTRYILHSSHSGMSHRSRPQRYRGSLQRRRPPENDRRLKMRQRCTERPYHVHADGRNIDEDGMPRCHSHGVSRGRIRTRNGSHRRIDIVDDVHGAPPPLAHRRAGCDRRNVSMVSSQDLRCR
jgi:hypothetical protein